MSESKPVKDFPNYLIYDDGRLFSIKRDRFLQGGLDHDGYRQVVLCRNGIRNTSR